MFLKEIFHSKSCTDSNIKFISKFDTLLVNIRLKSDKASHFENAITMLINDLDVISIYYLYSSDDLCLAIE